MKKNNLLRSIVLISLLPIYLFASFDDALKEYKKNNFAVAYYMLHNIDGLEKNSEQYYFYLGRCSFETAKNEEALENFNKLLLLKPNHERGKLEKARALFKLKKYKEAENLFKEVVSSDIPETVKKNINNYLVAIKKATTKHITSGAFITGIGYDTNVNNGNSISIGDVYQVSGFDDYAVNASASAAYHQEIFLFNHQYKFDDIDNIIWDSIFLAYNQAYNQGMDSSDISLFGITSGPVFFNGNAKYSLPLTIQKIFVARAPYMIQYDISPKIEYIYSKVLMLSSSFKYQEKEYQASDSSGSYRNSTYKELSLSANQVVNQSDSLTFSGLYGVDRKNQGSLQDVSKDIKKISLSYTKKLNAIYTSTVNYIYTNDTYTIASTLPKYIYLLREDIDRQYGLKINAKYSDKISFDIGYNYADHDSSFDVYKYIKSTYSVSMQVLF